MITRRLIISAPITLRGAGEGVTTLYFPYNLAQVYGNHPKPPEVRLSVYSLWFESYCMLV
jgi:hypothetical protein